MKEVCITPIGVVERESDTNLKDKNSLSKILLRKDLEPALEGIEDFSHLFILFWMHRTSREQRSRLKTHPRGRHEMPLLGVYATRTPSRQNPIGLTLVERVRRNGNILAVKGLDAFDGTPILDIKPYDEWDPPKHYKVPD
jgi:tRNA-Thr(GGU) m(6)t(6)A37 methyltransferase TsaA